MTEPNPDPLQARVEELQRQVARLSVVQQQLLAARHGLDRELERFAGIHAFNTKAIAVRDPTRFHELTAETVVDLFNLEFALVWPTAADGTPGPAPVAAVELAADAIPAATLAALVGEPGFRRRLTALWEAADRPELAALGLRQVAIGACQGPSGETFALVLGGVRAAEGGFYAGMQTEHLESFTVFAQQVGALLQNRADQATIEAQMSALRLEQERLGLALEGSNAGLWDWDLATGRFYLSPRWRAILGYAPEELSDTYGEWESRVHPEDLERSLALILGHFQGDTEVYENVHRLRHKDGHYVWVLALGRVLLSAAGEPLRLAGMLLDITEQRRARELAEAANRAKSEFLATVSHEIRTPLNGVLGMLQLIEETGPTPEQADYLNTARGSATALLGIINDILDLSKVEAGRLELHRDPFDPWFVLLSVVNGFREQARAKGLKLVAHIDPDLRRTLMGDAGRLRQVLTNLVANAIKFTARGEVTLEAEGSPIPGGGLEIHLRVRDSGIGIAPEVQERLFTPFTQADAGTAREYGGTGLGLAITRRLLDLMAGEVWVESSPGQGACFQVRVPFGPAPDGVEPEPVPAAPTPRPAPQPSTQSSAQSSTQSSAQSSAQAETQREPQPEPQPDRLRVLLVEDNRVNQKVAAGMLTKLGVATVLAADGQQALDAFAEGGLALVLMDIQMPVMDGHEATRRLRALELERGWPRTPVVALTANAMAEDREACLAAGMDDFIAKPFAKGDLVEALKRWGGYDGPAA